MLEVLMLIDTALNNQPDDANFSFYTGQAVGQAVKDGITTQHFNGVTVEFYKANCDMNKCYEMLKEARTKLLDGALGISIEKEAINSDKLF